MLFIKNIEKFKVFIEDYKNCFTKVHVCETIFMSFQYSAKKEVPPGAGLLLVNNFESTYISIKFLL